MSDKTQPILIAQAVWQPPGAVLLPNSFGCTLQEIAAFNPAAYQLTIDLENGFPIENQVLPVWFTPSMDIAIDFAFATRSFTWAPVGPNQLLFKVKHMGGVSSDFQFPPPGYTVTIQIWRSFAGGP